MKYIVVLTDGAADYPIADLGNKTPFEAAKTPCLDALASGGQLCLVKTVPDNLKPGSDVANLSVMGYAPHKYYTGRSPLEAASIGIDLGEDDMTFRANLVTLSDEADYASRTMVDYSAGEISTDEASELIRAVDAALSTDDIRFFPGVSYRHIMRWHNAPTSYSLTPPHDISGRKVTDYLPDNGILLELMKKSSEILTNHPINAARRAAGKNPANSIWIWGEGRKPALSSFSQLYGISGSVISAVDLIKGIAKCARLNSIDVEGATGTVHTNYDGKAKAAVDALLSGSDFIYIHLEGPDECGHQGDLAGKVRAIELIDEKIIAPIRKAMEDAQLDYSFLVMPDHPTPISTKTHARDAVPCLIYRSDDVRNNPGQRLTEACAEKTGILIQEGYTLMDKFLRRSV